MASQKRLGFGCGLDLAQSVLGQGLDGYAGTGRIGVEVLCVYLIESGKVAHVRQETGGLEHFVGTAAGGFQNGNHVLAALIGLCRDVCGHLTGDGVNRQLTGGIDSIADHKPLRVGADSTGGVFSIDYAEKTMDADWAFHHCIAELSENHYLITYTEQLMMQAHRNEMHFFKTYVHPQQSYEAHRRIIKALEEHDLESAKVSVCENWQISLQ